MSGFKSEGYMYTLEYVLCYKESFILGMVFGMILLKITAGFGVSYMKH